MYIDILDIILNQFFILNNEIKKTKKELLFFLKKENIHYKLDTIDIHSKNECIFIYTKSKKRIQILLCNNKISSIFLDVYGAYYYCKGKKVRNCGIDNLLKIINKENIYWKIENFSKRGFVLKIKNILFYFDYDLKYPLYKIGYY